MIVFVAVPALIWLARRDGAPAQRRSSAALAALAVAVVALGYPVQRHYLNHRFANVSRRHLDPRHGPRRRLPLGARDRATRASASPGPRPASPATASTAPTSPTTSVYLGEKGPHGAFNAIPTCAGFRAAVNDADLDYLVTSPFLNFLHPSKPIPSPEARWLRGAGGVEPLLREGQVTVWKVDGPLDPTPAARPTPRCAKSPNTPGA